MDACSVSAWGTCTPAMAMGIACRAPVISMVLVESRRQMMRAVICWLNSTRARRGAAQSRASTAPLRVYTRGGFQRHAELPHHVVQPQRGVVDDLADRQAA